MILRYLLAGLLSFGTNFGLFYIFTRVASFAYLPSAVLAFIGSIFVSFFVQKQWTFRDRSTHETPEQFARYFFVCLINLALNTALIFVAVEFLYLSDMFAVFLASVAVAISGYMLYQRFVFTHPSAPSL